MQPPPSEEPPPSTQMSAELRAKASLEQRMLEAQLEIVRSARQRRESRRGRLFWAVSTLLLSLFVAYLCDHNGASQKLSFVAGGVTFIVLTTWWAFRRPF